MKRAIKNNDIDSVEDYLQGGKEISVNHLKCARNNPELCELLIINCPYGILIDALLVAIKAKYDIQRILVLRIKDIKEIDFRILTNYCVRCNNYQSLTELNKYYHYNNEDLIEYACKYGSIKILPKLLVNDDLEKLCYNELTKYQPHKLCKIFN